MLKQLLVKRFNVTEERFNVFFLMSIQVVADSNTNNKNIWSKNGEHVMTERV